MTAPQTLSDRVAALIASGLRNAEIAAQLGCHPSYVSMVRQRRKKAAQKAAMAASAPAKDAAPAIDPLLATGGRYRDLAAYAAQNGMTSTQALAKYHRMRAAAPAAKKGAA